MRFFIIISITFFFVACKKTPPIQSVLVSNTRDSLTYQPKEQGAKWIYTRNVLGTLTTYNYARIAPDTILYSNVFNMFQSDIDGLQYIRQDGGKYYNILTASTNKPALLILDTSKNIGESWVGGVNGNDTYTYTMKRKIILDTVIDLIIFKKMMVVHLERTTGGNTTISGDTYYARGVGHVLTTGIVSGFPVEIRLKKYE